MFAVVVYAAAARADIFQWEYIDPLDPSQGKRQSTTLAPGGAGVDAVPGADLSSRNLTMAYFKSADLSNANFLRATLTDADFTEATVKGSRFNRSEGSTYYPGAAVSGTGISLPQLYSTASYQAHDLTGIGLAWNDLTGGNFAGQNLTNANFVAAILTEANFDNADVRGANFRTRGHECGIFGCGPTGTGITVAQLYSTASYQAHDLTGVGFGFNDLTGASFAGQNLTNADFSYARLVDSDFREAKLNGFFNGTNLIRANFAGQNLANVGFYRAWLGAANFREANLTGAAFNEAPLTDADFTGADVRGASFIPDYYGDGRISLAQLYTTASYQVRDLSGISLERHDLSGGNFAGQNLTYASFHFSTLTDADFRHANLTNASFYRSTLTDADFTSSDARGALYASFPIGAITTNLISPDGHITGLGLGIDGSLIVRDYDGDSRPEPASLPIPITVDQHFAMASGGTLRMVFEADAWDSTISFAPGIPVALGGTLELEFADDVSLASQVGRTVDLFDWTGVAPTGTFTVTSPYAWNLSNLYTTGQVTLHLFPEPTSCSAILVCSLGLTFHRRRNM
jgi:uncharacterized protein YjbI with pentapeptide repeats